MNSLPYCDICGKQIVDAPAIGWHCPTIMCGGSWPQKANIVFSDKTEVEINRDISGLVEMQIKELIEKQAIITELSENYNRLLIAVEVTVNAQQARIDELMCEYCPDEMTEDQIAEWEKHQKARN